MNDAYIDWQSEEAKRFNTTLDDIKKHTLEYVEVTDNWYLTKRGMVFSYFPYEVGSYTHGQVELFIPANKLDLAVIEVMQE